MNIIVLVKQVPDTTEVKLDPKTGTLIREGIDSIINPDDRHAIEASIDLKERYGGRVTVISMGPPQAIDAISEAIGMGADEGILLSETLPVYGFCHQLFTCSALPGNEDIGLCRCHPLDEIIDFSHLRAFADQTAKVKAIPCLILSLSEGDALFELECILNDLLKLVHLKRFWYIVVGALFHGFNSSLRCCKC